MSSSQIKISEYLNNLLIYSKMDVFCQISNSKPAKSLGPLLDRKPSHVCDVYKVQEHTNCHIQCNRATRCGEPDWRINSRPVNDSSGGGSRKDQQDDKEYQIGRFPQEDWRKSQPFFCQRSPQLQQNLNPFLRFVLQRLLSTKHVYSESNLCWAPPPPSSRKQRPKEWNPSCSCEKPKSHGK